MRSDQQRASRFILSPGADLAFVLGMPAVALLILPLSRVLSSVSVWAVVMTFGAVGHHLPGFLRTYGDRALFRRFKWRFLLAPPFFFAANFFFALRDLHGMALITIVWSLWHGMMQHYGFMRIYDAKAGTTAPWIARLDWWMSLSWFSTSLVASAGETGSLLEALFAAGFGPPPPLLLHVVTILVVIVTALLSIAYVAAVVVARRRGTPMSPMKLVVLVGTSALLVIARVITRDHFLTAALFEVLHDVQYLAIVWAFNHRLVDEKIVNSTFTRRLFAKGRGRPFLYAGLCLAYGAIAWWAAPWEPAGDILRRGFLALLATSGLLHFYYDGFIWKMRRPETRAGFGLALRTAAHLPATPRPLHSWSAALPAAYLVVPVLLVGGVESLAPPAPPAVAARSLAFLTPTSGLAQADLGDALFADGALTDALAAYDRALALEPGFASARAGRAETLRCLGRTDEAREEATRALADHADLFQAHLVVADVLAASAHTDEAVAHYRAALAHGADDARAHNNFGNALAALHRDDEAQGEYRLAALRAPGVASIRVSLGVSLARSGHIALAVDELRAAVRLAPDSASAHANLGAALARTGNKTDAIEHLARALALNPDDAGTRGNLDALRRSIGQHSPP